MVGDKLEIDNTKDSTDLKVEPPISTVFDNSGNEESHTLKKDIEPTKIVPTSVIQQILVEGGYDEKTFNYTDSLKWYSEEDEGFIDMETFLRDEFPPIPHPERGYKVGDIVGHRNRFSYEVVSADNDGDVFELEGRENWIVRCSRSEFRHMADLVDAVLGSMVRQGRIDRKKIIRIDPVTGKVDNPEDEKED